MSSGKNTYIQTRNAQSPSYSPAVIGNQSSLSGSDGGEIIQRVPSQATSGGYDEDLLKDIEDFIEYVRREVALKEAREIATAIFRARKPIPFHTHPNAGIDMADADVVPHCTQHNTNQTTDTIAQGNFLAILQPGKPFRSSALCHKISTCGGRRQVLRSTRMAYRLGDREIARVIQEV